MTKKKSGVIVNIIGAASKRHASGCTTGCVITIEAVRRIKSKRYR